MNQASPRWNSIGLPGRLTPHQSTGGRLLLRNVLLTIGMRADVVVSGGEIAAVVPAGGEQVPDAEVVDLSGHLLLPAFAEPHAHLDKALTVDAFPNSTGDLNGAIEAIKNAWGTLTVEDTIERARTAARKLVLSGTTAIRTHADTIAENGSKSMEALVAIKDQLADVCDIQIVALAHPVTGPDRAAGRAALKQAIEMEADVVGGAPHIEFDPAAAIGFGLRQAAAHGLSADFHLDEVLDRSVQHLAELARQTTRLGMEGRVTASHCVSHGLLPPADQRELGRMLTDSGVSVVALPRTNLFLQARAEEQGPPRGLPGLRALLGTGVTVAAGGDNLQDPFYPIGRSDPLETATLLVATAHLTVDEAFAAVTSGARRVMGLKPLRIEAGYPAELVAVRACSIREAIAEQPADRVVIHKGKVVARTTADAWVAGG